VKFSYLIRGLPGHPSHPPLTDATIGIYTFATVAAVLSKLGIAEEALAQAWWLALVVGLIVNAPTAVTGIVDWFDISPGTPLKRTATLHWIAMTLVAAFFGLAAIFGHAGYGDAAVETLPFLLTLTGFAMLTVGGWLGGTVVFVHGMRVLRLQEEPTHRAAAPVPHPEKELAEGG
jgi:uncharacterized membrane protein